MVSLGTVLHRYLLFISVFIVATIFTSTILNAAALNLTWQDNSNNEDGFKIERKVTGNYAEISSVGPNIESFSDSGLASGTQYCYRVRAFNTSGVSSPSNEVCATTPISPTTNFALSLTRTGSGTGTITSSPTGINCGSDCSESYAPGTAVSLTVTPASGSRFAGWSGNSDCSDGKVTLDADKSCTATFAATTATLRLTKKGRGKGNNQPIGIDCGNKCSNTFAAGTMVTLSATTPTPSSRFAGWSGGDCEGQGDCTVSLDSATSTTAMFVGADPSAIGIFRPATGDWFLDVNRNGLWDGCGVDRCFGPFGENGDVPLVGDWTGTGISAIGVYRPSTGEWLLDLNRNGEWDGCQVDLCLTPFRHWAFTSPESSAPVVGDWTGTGIDMIGAMSTEPTTRWHLDVNGNGSLGHCKTDACFTFIGDRGDVPLAGDWNGNGTANVGIFRPASGEWFLDLNGNGQWDDCNVDKCLQPFGAADDIPVAGKWTGTGVANVGLFRPATGEWFLDLNGNGQWDDCGVDGCFPFVGQNQGDLPVVGIW